MYYSFQHVYELHCDSKCLTDSEIQMCMCIKRQQGKSEAWIATLITAQDSDITNTCPELSHHGVLSTIHHSELQRAQKEDPAIREIIKLKENNQTLTREVRSTFKTC